jgi:hypothetical protein
MRISYINNEIKDYLLLRLYHNDIRRCITKENKKGKKKGRKERKSIPNEEREINTHKKKILSEEPERKLFQVSELKRCMIFLIKSSK